MTQNSNKRNVDKAVNRYSSLFTLPSYKDIIILSGISCIVAGIAADFPFQLSFYGLSFGLSLGVFIFFATLFGNYLTLRLFLRDSPILNLRRFSFLALISNWIMLAFVFTANLVFVTRNNADLWIKIMAFGFFASISLRFLVLCSVSSLRLWKVFFSVLLQPTLFLVPVLISPFLPLSFQSYHFLHFLVATLAAFFSVYLFIMALNTIGMKTFGIPSIKLFRAFLTDWIEGIEEPFEEILEELSEERNVKVSLIALKSGGRIKAVIVVPNLHPGPFKNVGSSSIPNLIQETLERKFGCVIAVPHGISGHELDLPSHVESEKVVNKILEASEFSIFHTCATPFLTLKEEDANVGCQIFGDCPLLTLTCAPKTMEDLPLELNDTIIQEAKRRGFAWAVPIDAHNSIEGVFNFDTVAAPMKKTVADVLEEASRHKQSRFEVGAAKIVPKEFGVKEGMGSGGIVVIVVKVGNRKTAYVTIDGNNMVPHLREKILSNLQKSGMDGGEVLTTDTHTVNGVVITEKGYYPVGEMIDHDKLIEYVEIAMEEALRSLEPAEASWRHEEISGVKTIGEQQIGNLCMIVDRAAIRAKKNAIIVFPAFGILLAVLLALL